MLEPQGAVLLAMSSYLQPSAMSYLLQLVTCLCLVHTVLGRLVVLMVHSNTLQQVTVSH